MTTRAPLRHRLSNGLRVVLDPDPRRARVAVGLAVGVGFRHERPGQEGLAHLVEHLFFGGSATVPPGGFRAPVHRVGGLVNGTTHQDYTEFHQVAPPAALERLLFTDADRLRAPVVTDATLAEQLTVVIDEIRQATGDRRLGGLPWPRLPKAVFRRFADAHDGYGDPRRLARTTVHECRDFLHRHYTATNTVLTVAGSFDPDEAMRYIGRYFADLPSRPIPPAPAENEPAGADDRWHRETARLGGLPGAVAVGIILPDGMAPTGATADLTAPTGATADPTAPTARYAAALTVATTLGRRLPGASTGLGFFGPLDTRAPEVLVLTGPLMPDVTGPHWLEGIRTTLQGWAAGGLPDGELRAARRVARHDLLGAADDLVERTRTLGRTELLFGRPVLVDELPAAVAAVSPAEVAAAAGALAAAPAGGVQLRPSQPHPHPVTAPAPAGPATGVTRAPSAPPDPAGLPPVARDTGFRLPTSTLVDDDDLRVVLVADPGSAPDRVHLAGRWPWGTAGWARPGAVDDTIAYLRAELPAEIDIGTDGQWLTVAAAGDRDEVPGWLTAVGAALRPDHPGGPARVAPAPQTRSPARLADDVQRVLTLGLPAEGPTVVGPREVLAGLGPGALVLTAPAGSPHLPGWSTALAALRRAAARHGRRPTGTAMVVDGPDRIRRVPVPGADRVQVSLMAWTGTSPRPAGAAEAAAYLATAVFGSWFDSRLARRGRAGGWTPLFGRDTLLDRPRVFLRAEVDPTAVDRVLDDLAAECRDLARHPLSDREIESARLFCRGQLRSVADSPAGLAAALAAGMVAGRPSHWLDDLDAGLRTVDPQAVRCSAADLFRWERFGGVLLGAVVGDEARIGR